MDTLLEAGLVARKVSCLALSSFDIFARPSGSSPPDFDVAMNPSSLASSPAENWVASPSGSPPPGTASAPGAMVKQPGASFTRRPARQNLLILQYYYYYYYYYFYYYYYSTTTTTTNTTTTITTTTSTTTTTTITTTTTTTTSY